MASNTDTLLAETDGTTGEPPQPGRNRRGAVTWVAIFAAGIAVAALAIATLSGGDHDGDVTARSRAAQLAEREERQAHLEGQARTYGSRSAAAAAAAARSRAAQLAEREERQAHLEGQARTYGSRSAAAAAAAARSRAAQLAEREERQAHLEGQARTYGSGSPATSGTPAPTSSAPEPE